jgi:UDP-GlcNAc:undecaprenyl-phosphate/decaprenyl-phosphate GlcNAc-1-phosphate transferase
MILILFTVILSASLTFVVRRIALYFNIEAKNNYRRHHEGSIALWGGVGLYLTLIASYILQPNEILKNIILGSFPLLIVGMADDCFELKAGVKFCVQFISALLWLNLNPEVTLLQSAGLPHFLSLGLSAFWIVGLCNAFNLIDGTDGQCSMVGAIAFIVIGLSFPTLVPVALPLVGALLGFLIWNCPPARIYLGESGSTIIGFSLATASLAIPSSGFIGSSFLGILFLASFPLTDTLLAIARRIVKKRPIFSGDKDHIHHLLQKVGLNKFQVLFIVGFMILAGDLTAFMLFKTSDMLISCILAVNNSALMSFILLGLYYTKKFSAQKISYFGRSLLEKHMQHIDVYPIPEASQKAYLIDLLPYYAELQNGGTLTIVNFVKEISKHFGSLHKYNLYSVGSYSIAAVFRDGHSWSSSEKKAINQQLKDIFEHFGVLKSLSETPEGIYYFDKDNMDMLLGIIGGEAEKEPSLPLLQRVS